MKREVLGAAMSLSLAVSHTTAAAGRQEYGGPEVTPAALAEEIQGNFTALQNYWTQQVPDLNYIQLDVIQENEAVFCGVGKEGVFERATDPTVIEYCIPTDSILISQAGIDTLQGMSTVEQIPLSDIFKIVVAHEFGHAVQDSRGSSSIDKSYEDRQALEQNADCLGGIAVSQLFPDTLEWADEFYSALGSSPMHGTAKEREKSFMTGARTGAC